MPSPSPWGAVFTPLPYVKVHLAVLRALTRMGLTEAEKLVAIGLISEVRVGSVVISISEAQLGFLVGVSLRSVQRAIRKFKALGLVVVQPGSPHNHVAARYNLKGFLETVAEAYQKDLDTQGETG